MRHQVNKKQINVLLITLDTTRADRLGCYGYAMAHTPSLDSLAGSGALFENAFCNVPLTLPSHATILTGLLPPEHGVRVNTGNALPLDIPTLAELLSEDGYDTAAFIASPVLAKEFGLDRGFAVYDDSIPTEQDPKYKNPYRPANSVIDAAITWLGRTRNSPFFCWIHIYDPHFPYDSHPDVFGSVYTNRPYDAEIAFADLHIERVLRLIKNAKLKDKTLLVAVGDHGESLKGEHQEPRPFHGYMLHRSTMHVPLILSLPGTIPEHIRIDDAVSLADLAPTILSLTGTPISTQMGSGRILTPLLQNSSIPAKPVYAETMFPLCYECSPATSLFAPPWHLIESPQASLYNMDEDPSETNDLSLTRPDITASMQQQLKQTSADLHRGQRHRPSVALSSTRMQQLASLGYVGLGTGVEDLASAPRKERDIRTVVGLIQLGHEAESMASSGKIRKALRIWKTIVAEHPDCHLFRNSLACMLLQAGKTKQAIREFERLKEATMSEKHSFRDPRYPALANNLAFALAQTKDYRKALPFALQAVEMSPLRSEFYHTLAVIYRGLNNSELAMRNAKKAVALDSETPEYLSLLAHLHSDQGNKTDAVGLAKQVLSHDIDTELREDMLALLRDTYK